MTKKLIARFALLIIASLLVYCLFAFINKNKLSMPELIAQLEGKNCKYKKVYLSPCERRYFWDNISAKMRWGPCRTIYRRYGSLVQYSDTGVCPENNLSTCVSDAAQCLTELGRQTQEAVPFLIAALKKYADMPENGESQVIQANIGRALSSIGEEGGIPLFIESLKSDDAGTVSMALGVLESFGPKARDAIPYIIPHLIPHLKNDGYHNVQRGAAAALGRIAGLEEESVDALVAALEESSDQEYSCKMISALASFPYMESQVVYVPEDSSPEKFKALYKKWNCQEYFTKLIEKDSDWRAHK